MTDKVLGHATAYGYYKAGGGTMTEAEFTEFMADFGTASQTAVEAAQAALASETASRIAATTATNKASEATTAATTATNKAAEAQADADAAALDASQALSAASTATTKATEATTAAATATSAKTDAVAANTAAQSAKTAAQTAQTGAETAAASVEASAAQIATNTEDISQLKSDLTATNAELADVRVGADGTTYNSAGAAVRGQISDLNNALIYTQSNTTINDGVSVGGYDGNDITPDAAYVSSEFIDISHGLESMQIRFYCYLSSWRGYAFYDKNKNFISGLYGNIAAENGYTNGALNDIKTNIPENAYFLRITRNKNDGYSVPSDIKVHYFRSKYNNSDIENIINNTPIVIDKELTVINGHYIGSNGSYNSDDYFSVSTPIQIDEGCTIEFTASGSANNVAIISTYENGIYSPVVIADTSSVKKYTYVATEENQFVFCYRTANNYTLNVYKTLYDSVSNINEKIDVIPELTETVAELETKAGTNYTTLFKVMHGIGDSLMSGEIYHDSASALADCYNYSWLAFLSTKNMAKWECFSQGGLTTKSWLNSHWRTDFETSADIPDSIFIGLGSNDKNNQSEIPTGSATDAAGTATFCGYYKQIIEIAHTKNPHAKIYCCSLYVRNTLSDIYSALIQQIASQYEYAYFLDLANTINIDLSVNSVYAENSHYSTIGYLMVAEAVYKLLNASISENMQDFKYFGLYNNR